MTGLGKYFIGLIFSISLFLPDSASAQGDVKIEVQHLNGNIYAIFGRGGNIGMSAGDEGVFLIDDQYAPLTPKILAAIREIDDGPIRFVLNTHWHGDHTGGNENLGNEGAMIIAHDNVRLRLIEGLDRGNGRITPPAAEGALPVLTFNDQVSLFINGEEARAIHVENAHTDGDSLIYFRDANVLHAGDTFFNGRFPFVDVASGGSIDGLIAAIELALSFVDDDTIIIPGHGPIATRADLGIYLEMLTLTRERVAALKAEGKSIEEIIAADPTADYNEKWTWVFINPEAFVFSVYSSLED
ncbi:MAG: MBL fold metallo-hydrolase [Sphingomonadales bacterium]